MLDEKEFLSPFGIRAISRIHQEQPYTYRVDDQEYRVSYVPGDSDRRHVRRQLELARPDLDAGQHADRPRAASVLPLLRGFIHDRVPDWIGTADEPLRGGGGDRAPPLQHLPEGRAGEAARARDVAQVPGRSSLERLPAVLRVLPRRHRRGGRREPPDGVDRGDRAHLHLFASRPTMRERSSSRRRPNRRARKSRPREDHEAHVSSGASRHVEDRQ